jgi:Ca2+-transporting ATPase
VNWHALHIEKVFELTHSSPVGLSPADAAERLISYGPNALKEKKKISPFLIFLYQFRDFMIIVLLVAAIISGFLGDVTDTIIIIAIILLNAIIGFVQEYRAEKAMEALKKMASTHAIVQRDGKPANIPSEELVPGDLVLLESGNIVPADLRLTDAQTLLLNESALTGESEATNKNIDISSEQEIPLGDRHNMVYKSTLVLKGRGAGIVILPLCRLNRRLRLPEMKGFVKGDGGFCENFLYYFSSYAATFVDSYGEHPLEYCNFIGLCLAIQKLCLHTDTLARHK